MISSVIYKKSINKFGEEVCGDNFQLSKTDNSKIAVLSDGLGSGIKASILSILTTEIISTMFKKGVEVEEIYQTIAKTLPVCKIRGIAYSTFSIVQVFKDGKIKIVNYDNPTPIIIRDGELYWPKYIKKVINGKAVYISNFYLEPDDFVFIFSDGIVHAGLGNMMDFGWGVENIASYIKRLYRRTRDIKYMVDNLVELTKSYYGSQPGDDSSVVGLKITEKPTAMIFTGPPLDPKQDEYFVEKFLKSEGKKIVCGGTTSNIVARIIDEEIEINFNLDSKSDIPPYGTMKGVDLVTEGVLTLKGLNNLLSQCKNNMFEIDIEEKNIDAAEKMFITIRDCDEITLQVGRKVNVFYHNPALPFDMSIRSNLIRDIKSNLIRLGKEVNVEYC